MADKTTQILVIGSGPGGYTAAFRAADLGQKVILIEYYETLGGVCLNVGCIPSKALLHVAKVLDETHELTDLGVSFNKPTIDHTKLREQIKATVLNKLTSGLSALSNQRKVEVVRGFAKFTDEHTAHVVQEDGTTLTIQFEHAIISVGSKPATLPTIPQSPKVMDSTKALELEDIPQELLIVGGGIIGLELGTIYSALGSNITLVELSDGLMPGADRDLVAPLEKRLRAKFKHIYTNTKVTRVIEEDSGLLVSLAGDDCPQQPVKFDKILLSVGRVPNGNTIDADKAGVKVDERGFIPVDNTMRTNISHIYAVGDVVGIPMLAHKSIPQGKVAAENIVGKKHFFDPKAIASVAYTDPEVAWVGLSESQAKEQGIAYEKGVFPWAASGRALASWRSEGMTKVLFDKVTKRIVGAGIVGPHAGDLICEAALAIEMGCDGEDIALTIHPHPTLGETLALATEMYEGSITDLIAPKK